MSPYTLTPLKLVYKKLRLLVDRGCIFIGHGLSKDFRIISEFVIHKQGCGRSPSIDIFVPPEQVIDTVDLYFIKARQRRLSLKFLTWFVLNENIQTEVHDSIEDARSALRLYKAYHEFEEQGIFDDKLDELYREGKQYVCASPPRNVCLYFTSIRPLELEASCCSAACHFTPDPACFSPSHPVTVLYDSGESAPIRFRANHQFFFRPFRYAELLWIVIIKYWAKLGSIVSHVQ